MHSPGQSPVSGTPTVARLATALVGLTFMLVLVGVLVRTTGSGLGCGTAGGWHDWPLCDGGVVPPLVVHSIIEYSHRILAFLVTIGVVALATVVGRSAELRQRFGKGVSLVAVLLLVQVVLGALTVRMLLPDKSIDPGFVVAHLATAMAFFGTLLVLALSARKTMAPAASPTIAVPRHVVALAGLATAGVYLQVLLGGAVASNNAGLACPDFPLCNGQWAPTFDGLVGLMVMHRLGAYTVVLLVVAFVAVGLRHAGAARRGAAWALFLVALQFALGVANVLLRLPLPVRIAHLGNAFLLFGALLSTFAALVPSRAPLQAAPTPDALAARS